MEWKPVFYNKIETNVEVTECGRVRRIKVNWLIYKTKLGEINFSKLKLSKGYKVIKIQIKGLKPITIQVHQLIAAAFLDYKWQGHKLVIDHIDNNPLNNNLNNLRVITNRENNSKERTIKSGLPVGVSFNKTKRKYEAYIYVKGKQIYLGSFNTPEQASEVYQTKLQTI
jgi:hypothetical protein